MSYVFRYHFMANNTTVFAAVYVGQTGKTCMLLDRDKVASNPRSHHPRLENEAGNSSCDECPGLPLTRDHSVMKIIAP